jgi:glucose dehydrogenase
MTGIQFLTNQRRAILLVLTTPLALCVLLAVAFGSAPPQIDSSDLDALAIFAYRDWQSTGVYVDTDEIVQVRATGQWMYTPGEWNDANGHRRYRAPGFYPLPGVGGGALIGKVGDNGIPFFVGEHGMVRTRETGILYLRIDDDILSDNEGDLLVQVGD